MFTPILRYFVTFLAGVVAALLLVRVLPARAPRSDVPPEHAPAATDPELAMVRFDSEIAPDAAHLMHDDDALYSFVKKFGLKQTLRRLQELMPAGGECHQAAHKAGRFAYAVFGAAAFGERGTECFSGAFHGAIEAHFRRNGTTQIVQDLDAICGRGPNAFQNHNCVHAIGHGLLTWTEYELPQALKGCDRLSFGLESCYSGVFMENVMAARPEHQHATGGHLVKYVSPDPQYPCNAVEERYKNACYFFQTSRMIQLFGSDFGQVAAVCGQAPALYRRSCFQSMGRDAGGEHPRDPDAAIVACGHAPAGAPRVWCLSGAVQDEFWEASGQDLALGFCRKLADTAEKSGCYDTLIERARDLLPVDADRNAFCLKTEAPFQDRCRSRLRDAATAPVGTSG